MLNVVSILQHFMHLHMHIHDVEPTAPVWFDTRPGYTDRTLHTFHRISSTVTYKAPVRVSPLSRDTSPRTYTTVLVVIS